MFDAQVEALSTQFRIVVPDLPGHGASPAFPGGSGFPLLADRLAALVAELRLQNFCLVGWSLGALVAWDLLARHPGIGAERLVTVDMVPRLLNDGDWAFGLRKGADHHVFDRQIELMKTDWAACTALFVPRIFAAANAARRQALIARTKSIALENDPESMAAIWQVMVEQDFRAVLMGLQLPSLVVAGAQSQLYPVTAAEWIAAQMPRAQLAVFGSSGHAPHMEQPEEFNQALADFAGDSEAQRVKRVEERDDVHIA